MAVTYNPNVNITVPNGGYATSSGTVSTVTLTGSGAGYTLASGAGGGSYNTMTWQTPPTNFHNGNGTTLMSVPHGDDKIVLEEKATLEVKGTVVINGVDLEERIERIETLLQIPTRDVTMEAKYPKLKKIWEEYNRELAKLKTWDALKGTEND